MSTKTCSCCKKSLPIEDFVKDKYALTGYKSHCKACVREKSKKYHSSIPKEIRAEKMRVWRNKNREHFNEYLKHYRGSVSSYTPKIKKEKRTLEEARLFVKQNKARYDHENKEDLRKYRKNYYLNPEKIEKRKMRIKNRMKNNPSAKMAQTLRCRLRAALKAQITRKSQKTFNLLGCSMEFFLKHLESLWLPGMNWANHGNHLLGKEPRWNVDHIRPCASFDLTKETEQKVCFHYTNLRPLWGQDNYKKRDEIIGCPWGYDFQI